MAEVLTSIKNPRIREVVRLRDRRGRKQSNLFLIDGGREIELALDAGYAIDRLFFCRELVNTVALNRVMDTAGTAGARLTEVTADVFSAIAYGNRAEGLLAVAPRPDLDLARLRLPDSSLLALVVGVEKPGNLGAILRTADAAGVDAVVAVDPVADIFGPNAIRASLGAIFSVPIAEAATTDVRKWLSDRQFKVISAVPGAETMYTEANYRGSVAVVFGSEAQGLNSAWQQEVEKVAVPMVGRVNSLNVSATATLLFYEAMRQRPS